MFPKKEVVAMLLAGGQGSRLQALKLLVFSHSISRLFLTNT